MSEDELRSQKDHDLLIISIQQNQNLGEKIDKVIEMFEAHDKRLRDLEVEQRTFKTQIGTNEKEIENLRVNNNIWKAVLAFAILVGSAIGIKF